MQELKSNLMTGSKAEDKEATRQFFIFFIHAQILFRILDASDFIV